MTYNWQQKDWPNFQYDLSKLYEKLLLITQNIGQMAGKFAHFSSEVQTEAIINQMIEEAIKTSEIEGEFLSRLDVRSSIKKKLGLTKDKLTLRDKRAAGIADLMLDARDTFLKPLTQKKLFDWHTMLLGSSKNPLLLIGHWRIDEEPMQIISNRNGRTIVHYEAPPARLIPKEMKKFITWFNNTAPHKPNAIHFAPVRAAIAHLYFESIHPFDDGNGRIGRAIAEKALAQGFGHPTLLSLSQEINKHKKQYYAALNAASQTNEITAWITYFVETILNAEQETNHQINFILKKTNFFATYELQLNSRQLKVIKRILQEGTQGFEGGMSAKKYMIIADTSKATATRDLQALLEMGAIRQIGQGRSARYELNL